MACPLPTIITRTKRAGSKAIAMGQVVEEVGRAAKAHCASTGDPECGVGRILPRKWEVKHFPPTFGPPPTTDEYEVTLEAEVSCEKQRQPWWKILIDAVTKTIAIVQAAIVLVYGRITIVVPRGLDGADELVELIGKLAKAAK